VGLPRVGELHLTDLDKVREVFATTRLYRVFTFCDTLDGALAAAMPSGQRSRSGCDRARLPDGHDRSSEGSVTSTSDKHPATPRLRFSLAPEPSRLLRARERIRDYLTAHCADPTTVNDIVLAVEEACTNAIRHSGSGEDIDVQLRFSGDELRVSIKDEGRGFDVESFDSHKRPDPLLDHGRGLYLISRLCDELRLRRDGGLEVDMVKRAARSSAGAPAFEGTAVIGQRHLAGERLRTMLDEIDEGFDAFDWEYRYVHVNAVSLRRLGKSLDELLGRTPWEVFPALEGSELARRYREAMELGRPSVLEHRSVVDGQWLEVRIYPTSSGISCYYRGIDERKRKEVER
jgi:PAS domain S-box-containing protein